jgi:hypothetical protein
VCKLRSSSLYPSLSLSLSSLWLCFSLGFKRPLQPSVLKHADYVVFFLKATRVLRYCPLVHYRHENVVAIHKFIRNLLILNMDIEVLFEELNDFG